MVKLDNFMIKYVKMKFCHDFTWGWPNPSLFTHGQEIRPLYSILYFTLQVKQNSPW